MSQEEIDVTGFEEITVTVPLKGVRQWVWITYSSFNVIGFAVNLWVLYVVSPLLLTSTAKVPKSILFYIFCLCISDLMTMIGMLLLIIEVVLGTWTFGYWPCLAYLVFDGLNKFMAPIIVFLISRTCYTTVCLGKKTRDRAASVKWAFLQLLFALMGVMFIMRPVFRHGQVFTFNLSANNETRQVTVMRKCSFLPPADEEFWFNIIACGASYVMPLIGIIYCYISVPFFLRKRALNSIVSSSNVDAAIKRVVATVLVLCAVYLFCWSPYWFTMFFNSLLNDQGLSAKAVVIVSYFIHLLPYVSCVAYPVIFTVMNRGIKAAHEKLAREHRKRFRSIADDATNTLRNAISRKTTMVRSRLSSFIVQSKEDLTQTDFTSSAISGQYLAVKNSNGSMSPQLVVGFPSPERDFSGSASPSDAPPLSFPPQNPPQIRLSPSDDEMNEGETLL
ncbi:unnamed protein product, partial [Mesorhabditis belari]|uniref:G-protein coupled receptors family 1 profile domain-containing protein n=1 Tax=Mesorhabditis belari TaxID=2138241 RepID=A0AAF3EAF9_9BILA